LRQNQVAPQQQQSERDIALDHHMFGLRRKPSRVAIRSDRDDDVGGNVAVEKPSEQEGLQSGRLKYGIAMPGLGAKRGSASPGMARHLAPF